MNVAEYRALVSGESTETAIVTTKSRAELMQPVVCPPSTRTRGAAKRRVLTDTNTMPAPATTGRGKRAKVCERLACLPLNSANALGVLQSAAPGAAGHVRSTRKGQQSDFETPMPGSASSARIKVSLETAIGVDAD